MFEPWRERRYKLGNAPAPFVFRAFTQGLRMSKQAMREEAERLIRETMARKALVVKQGDTRIETKCGKCGAPNRVTAAKGVSRVAFACKECGHKQETL
jgi:ribosomal protein S14